jgi:hypothetical protein
MKKEEVGDERRSETSPRSYHKRQVTFKPELFIDINMIE